MQNTLQFGEISRALARFSEAPPTVVVRTAALALLFLSALSVGALPSPSSPYPSMYVRGSFTAGVITNPPSGNLVGFGSMINYDADNWILFDVTIMGQSLCPRILAQRVPGFQTGPQQSFFFSVDNNKGNLTNINGRSAYQSWGALPGSVCNLLTTVCPALSTGDGGRNIVITGKCINYNIRFNSRTLQFSIAQSNPGALLLSCCC